MHNLPCLPPEPETKTEAAKLRKDDDDGGRFLLLSKTEGVADFDYRLARYGPGIETAGGVGAGAQAVAVADPFDGCDDKAYTVSKKHCNFQGLRGVNDGNKHLPFAEVKAQTNQPRPGQTQVHMYVHGREV